MSSPIKELAKKYYVKLTRKSPGSDKRIPKPDSQLLRETESRIKNLARGAPLCKKPTIAVNEKMAHHGRPCRPGQERTASYCVKKLAPYKPESTRWVRSVSPNKETRITVVCPK